MGFEDGIVFRGGECLGIGCWLFSTEGVGRQDGRSLANSKLPTCGDRRLGAVRLAGVGVGELYGWGYLAASLVPRPFRGA